MQYVFSKNEGGRGRGGGKRPFGILSNIRPFWYGHLSLRQIPWDCFSGKQFDPTVPLPGHQRKNGQISLGKTQLLPRREVGKFYRTGLNFNNFAMMSSD